MVKNYKNLVILKHKKKAMTSEVFEIKELFADLEDDIIKDLQSQLAKQMIDNYTLNNSINELIKKYEELKKLYDMEKQQNTNLLKNNLSLQSQVDIQKRKLRKQVYI